MLSQISDINSMSRQECLGPTKTQLFIITSPKSCNQRFGCLQWFGFRAFGPAKRSGHSLGYYKFEGFIVLKSHLKVISY